MSSTDELFERIIADPWQAWHDPEVLAMMERIGDNEQPCARCGRVGRLRDFFSVRTAPGQKADSEAVCAECLAAHYKALGFADA